MSVDIGMLERSARVAGELESIGMFGPCPDRRGAIVSRIAGLGDERELLAHTSDCEDCARALNALESHVTREEDSQSDFAAPGPSSEELGFAAAAADPQPAVGGYDPEPELPPLPRQKGRTRPGRAPRRRAVAAGTRASGTGRARQSPRAAGAATRSAGGTRVAENAGVILGCVLALIAAIGGATLALNALSGSSGHRVARNAIASSTGSSRVGYVQEAATARSFRTSAPPHSAVSKRARPRRFRARPLHRRPAQPRARHALRSSPAATQLASISEPSAGASAPPRPASIQPSAPRTTSSTPPPAATPRTSSPPPSYGGGWSGDFSP
jgi:hypothetical protein